MGPEQIAQELISTMEQGGDPNAVLQKYQGKVQPEVLQQGVDLARQAVQQAQGGGEPGAGQGGPAGQEAGNPDNRGEKGGRKTIGPQKGLEVMTQLGLNLQQQYEVVKLFIALSHQDVLQMGAAIESQAKAGEQQANTPSPSNENI